EADPDGLDAVAAPTLAQQLGHVDPRQYSGEGDEDPASDRFSHLSLLRRARSRGSRSPRRGARRVRLWLRFLAVLWEGGADRIRPDGMGGTYTRAVPKARSRERSRGSGGKKVRTSSKMARPDRRCTAMARELAR